MEKLSRIEMLMNMLEKEPKDVFLNYALAVEFVGEQKFTEAEKQFLKTLELNNEYLPCYYQLGQVSEKLKKEKEAIDHYKKGLELAKKQNNNKALNELNEAIWMLEDN
jgi:tetratricopeptide (TPR) repeat protein